VTKDEDSDWYQLKPAILGIIMEHLTSGQAVLLDGGAEVAASGAEDDEIVVQIKELLETRVRPAVAQDGGDITFVSFDGGVVYLKMQGACAGCPSSTATLKMGIENLLKHYVPEVIAVEPAQ
jgi:Fe-S cluster biogenesis protein NfuA